MLGTSEFGPQGEPPEAMQALGEGYSVVKLRGLPWNVTVDDITTFLAPIAVPQGGVHLMNGANGRPSGLAYVELSSEADGDKVQGRADEVGGGQQRGEPEGRDGGEADCGDTTNQAAGDVGAEYPQELREALAPKLAN